MTIRYANRLLLAVFFSGFIAAGAVASDIPVLDTRAASDWLAGAGSDSDNDGITDNEDNCTLVANSNQRDTDTDGFGNMCDPDFNNDRIISFADLAIMKLNFLQPGDRITDLNADDSTNFADLAMLKASFLGSPGPTGTDPVTPNCNCYFSSDCAGGNIYCDYGPGSFTVEDICYWRLPKPQGIPGAGCSLEYEGPWTAVCDGVCLPFASGSSIGAEDQALVRQAVDLWVGSMVPPSIAGGGPVNALLAQQAESLPFAYPTSSVAIGRHVADLLSIASEFGFYDYFCHYESYPNEPGEFVDLSSNACAVAAAALAMDALRAELDATGSGAGHIAQIAGHCSDWQTRFAPTCEAGEGALACMADRVRGLALFLSTPRVEPQNKPGIESLLKAGR